MPTPARLAGVGVFVLGGLSLFAVGLFMIGDGRMAFTKTFTVYSEFSKITGLQPGAIVRVSGAKAGTITGILPPNTPSGRFRVQLEIAETLHQLVRIDSLATIETEGLVGGNYLGVSTGTPAAPPVAPGGTIPGKEPFEIADLIQQMGNTITKVNTTIDDMQDDVRRVAGGIASTVERTNMLINDVGGDLRQVTASGVRIASDAELIAEGIRTGKGALGKFVNDDQLYDRVTAISGQVEDIATNARQLVERANTTIEGLQSKDGPVQGMTASVKQTMDDARSAMAGFAENMDALKHNFLLRGFFNGRGYFDLSRVSPADYRRGVLTKSGGRHMVREWLRSDVLFEPEPDHQGNERLTDAGRAQIDSAIAPYLEYVVSGIVIVEGYAQQGTREEQYLRSRTRGSLVRDHLLGRFHLDPEATGAMPLGAESTDSPGHAPWDGVALAVILPRNAQPARK